MDELHVVRREDRSLIVANEAGDEFRLVIDAAVLAELRQASRDENPGSKVRPREIQALVRAGKSRSEIAELLEIEESDIERYEGPVLAERRFILSSAHSVPVRTSPAEQSDQQFGAVIAERLIGLDADAPEWDAWRDEEAGWMIGLEFRSQEIDHRAVWSFDHRKSVLSPLTPDAVSLSKQGEVGDRLIPKLRAVDDPDGRGRFDSGAFDRDELPDRDETTAIDAGTDTGTDPAPFSAAAEAALKAGHPSTGSIPVIDVDSDFARRREIEERAIKTSEPDMQDLGQTADLLAALRRRRGERDGLEAHHHGDDEDHVPSQPVPLHGPDATTPFAEPAELSTLPLAPSPGDAQTELDLELAPTTASSDDETARPEPRRSKGRAPIPSWDDILFGTRSEGDD